MRDDLFLITYGSIVSSTWFLAYLFIESAWDIVYLDGIVHLVCGSVVALAVLNIPQLKQVEVVAVLILVLFFWEVLEGGMFDSLGASDGWFMDTASDIMLGAIGGLIIIFDGHKLENLEHQGD